MAKNGQKEVINLSFLNKNNKSEEQSKLPELNKNNEIAHPLEEKKDKKENLPKLCLKKDNNNTNNNNLLNQKRERTQNNSKEAEEEINNNNNNNINNANNAVNSTKKKMSVNEAKKEMKDFELLINNTEKEIQKKYGFTFPDLSYEDNLPDDIKNKLIDNFLESPKIKKRLTEINSQK